MEDIVTPQRDEPIFFEKPSVLIKDCTLPILPSMSQAPNERLNTLMRLVILITLIMYLLKNNYALIFGIVGIALIYLIYNNFSFNTPKIIVRENFRPDRAPPHPRIHDTPIIAPHSHSSDWFDSAHLHSHVNKRRPANMTELTPYGSYDWTPELANALGPRDWRPCNRAENDALYPPDPRNPEIVNQIREGHGWGAEDPYVRAVQMRNEHNNIKTPHDGIAPAADVDRMYDTTQEAAMSGLNDSDEYESAGMMFGNKRRTRENFEPWMPSGRLPYGYTPDSGRRNIFGRSIEPRSSWTPSKTVYGPHSYTPAGASTSAAGDNPQCSMTPPSQDPNQAKRPLALGPICAGACCTPLQPINANLGITAPGLMSTQLGQDIPAYYQPSDLAFLQEEGYLPDVPAGSHITNEPSGLTKGVPGIIRMDPQFARLPPKIGTAGNDTIDYGALKYMPQPWTEKFQSACPNRYPPRDGRLEGITTGCNAYDDQMLGQVRYDYGYDDAFTRPTYIIRSNVDHIAYTDPMNKVTPEYFRTPMEQRSAIDNHFTWSQVNFREDMMERMMRKRDSELPQLVCAPLRGDLGAYKSSVV